MMDHDTDTVDVVDVVRTLNDMGEQLSKLATKLTTTGSSRSCAYEVTRVEAAAWANRLAVQAFTTVLDIAKAQGATP